VDKYVPDNTASYHVLTVVRTSDLKAYIIRTIVDSPSDVGVSVCWCVAVSICWCVGALMCWCGR
jgi:hypothetical protein